MLTLGLHKLKLKTTPVRVKRSTMPFYPRKHYYARKMGIIIIPDQTQVLHAGLGAHNENLTQW